MKIVSYNISCGWSGDGINSFEHRAGMIYKKLRGEKPEIIAFQEIVPPVRDYLEAILPDYYLLGHFRGPDYDGEGLFTAIRRDAFELLGYETFWLSPTPYVPGSRYENQSECPRICIVTAVRNKKTGERLRLYNIHLDHISDEARIEGMRCILSMMEKADEKGAFESILLGDFNAVKGSGTIALCETYEKRRLTDTAAALPCTFHNYGREHSLKIDYIYVTNGLLPRASGARVWDDCENGIFLSDHYPVVTDIAD